MSPRAIPPVARIPRSTLLRFAVFAALLVIGFLLLSSVLGWLALSGTVILHEGSTILVVLNALRLLRYH